MAFNASNIIPQEAYQTTRLAAVTLKLNLESFRAQMAAGNISYDFVRGVYRTLVRATNQFTAMKGTPGLLDYAKSQEDNPLYDVAAEFTGMQNAISSAISWLEANVPTAVTAKPVASWDDGTLIATEFTPAQTEQLRTRLAAVIATIN